MIAVKSTTDLEQFPEPLAKWLKQENPYLEDEFWEPSAGYLLVLDANDKVDSLVTGIDALVDLNEIDCWEWADFNEKLQYYCCCVILDDGFGMVFAIPAENIHHFERLKENITSAIL